MVDVDYSSEAQDQFAELPRPIKVRILKLVERLQNWPAVSGAKPLSGDLAGFYRLRTEDVIIEKIGHRDRFYEE